MLDAAFFWEGGAAGHRFTDVAAVLYYDEEASDELYEKPGALLATAREPPGESLDLILENAAPISRLQRFTE